MCIFGFGVKYVFKDSWQKHTHKKRGKKQLISIVNTYLLHTCCSKSVECRWRWPVSWWDSAMQQGWFLIHWQNSLPCTNLEESNMNPEYCTLYSFSAQSKLTWSGRMVAVAWAIMMLENCCANPPKCLAYMEFSVQVWWRGTMNHGLPLSFECLFQSFRQNKNMLWCYTKNAPYLTVELRQEFNNKSQKRRFSVCHKSSNQGSQSMNITRTWI